MNNLHTPVIGYLGDLRELDIALLEFLASNRPAWEFVLIGGLPGGLLWRTELLRGLDNVRFIGARQYEQLRSYLKLLDVCLVPYVRADGDRISSASRLYEYLAIGKPVFAWGTGKLEEPAPVERVARTPWEFQEAIDVFLADCPREARIALVDDDSWTAAVLDLMNRRSRRPARLVKPKPQPLPA